jgi:hypothetical protein
MAHETKTYDNVGMFQDIVVVHPLSGKEKISREPGSPCQGKGVGMR